MTDNSFSSDRAYRAAVELLDIVSQRTGSESLFLLQSVAELTDFGDSADPAILDSWRNLWGDAPERNERDTLDVISRFILQEGIWDPDDRAPHEIRVSVERYLLGEAPGQFIADWRTAVWRNGNRYRKM